MAEILIPLPSVERAPYVGAPVDPAAAVAPTRALAGLGESLQDVGHAVAIFRQKTKQAKDGADLVRARDAMRAAEMEAEGQIEQEQDETKWGDLAASAMDKARTRIGELQLSPEVAARIDAEFEGWSEQTRLKVGNEATKRTAAKADQDLQNETMRAADQGNLVAVEEMIRQRVAYGFLHESEADAVRGKMVQRAEVMQANRAISENPIEFLAALEETTEAGNPQFWRHLDENQRLQLKREARMQVSVIHEETVRDFQDRLNNGEKVSSEEMQTAVDEGRMTPQQFKNLARYQSGTANYADNVVRIAEISRRISAWSPGDQDAQIELNKIAADMGGLPRSMQEPLETMLRNRAAGGTKASETVDAERYVDRLYGANFFGNVREQGVNDDEPGAPVDRGQFVAANQQVVRLKSALEKFMRDNPGATSVEQIAFIDKEIRGDRAKRGATSVLNSSSGRSR